MSAEVVSLAERLRQRRDELGISQAQAARELDVARTAYRLWEMEAAKPSPDRWRLISRWLGVSVTTMLLAEDLISDEEATFTEQAASDFGRTGGEAWDESGARRQGNFYAQARELVADGRASGALNVEHAEVLRLSLDRIEAERADPPTASWEAAELRKAFPLDRDTPRAACDALDLVGADAPEEHLQRARALLSVLIMTCVHRAGAEPDGSVGVFIGVYRDRLRVEVSDTTAVPTESERSDESHSPLVIPLPHSATRWGGGREGDVNLAWFELDLPVPGS